MAETVKKSRIVSDDDLEETLMEEFNLRLKSCLSQEPLEPDSEYQQKDENLYENIESVRNTTELFSTKTISRAFIETERREEILSKSPPLIENGRQEISNGHDTSESIYENVQNISKPSSDYVEMQMNVQGLNGSSNPNADAIYEDVQTRDQTDKSGYAEETCKVDAKPSFTLFSAASLDVPEKVEVKSAKDRMLLSSDDTSTLLFTQTVTSPMLTPSEENVDFLKGFREETSPDGSPKDCSRSEDSPKTNGLEGSDAVVLGSDAVVLGGDGVIRHDVVETIGEMEREIEAPHPEKYQNQVENIYENLETMGESIYENVENLRKVAITGRFDKLDESRENSTGLDDSEPFSEDVPEIVSQIEQHKTHEFIDEDDVTEISDVCSLDKQVSDSDSSNLVLDNNWRTEGRKNSDKFGVIQDFIENERFGDVDGDASDEIETNGDLVESHDEGFDPQIVGYNDAEVMEYIAMTEEPKKRHDHPAQIKDYRYDDGDLDDEIGTKPDGCGDHRQDRRENEVEDASLEHASPTQTRIVDEIVKNYVVTKADMNLKNREKDTETVPPKIVQNLTSQFMKNGDEKDDGSAKNKKHDASHLKSVDIMKQINKFEHKEDALCDSTQFTESYVETTTFDSSMGEKAMKKKKSKKSRKEEKENISVSDTNLDSFYNVNVKNLRSKSLSDTLLTSNQRYFDKVFSGVSVKALKERFNSTSPRDQERIDKRSELSLLCSSSQNLAALKSSFSKFDALQKKNLLHVRSSDSSKAQEKFNGTTIDTTNCKCCGKQVFQMEQMKAEKAIWHKNCFRCHECSKQLNVDTYESHEGTLYCKPHFRALFAPRVVDDTDEPPKQRKAEVIIRENQPLELPPDVVRASDKPDLGLEELQSLNVKERFQVFEQHQSMDNTMERTQVNVKRSPSILSKLARFQAKGMDIGVADDSLNGIPIEESSSEGEEEEEDIPDGEDPDLVRAKRVQKEKPFHFTGMSDVKNKWEHGEPNTKDERREERKQEIQSIRNKLFMGKQGKMKEAYQEAVMKSESSVTSKMEEIKACDTKIIKERFEQGKLVQETSRDGKDEDDQEVFESEISKSSRSLFLQLDANASKAPQISPLSPPKLEQRKAREAYVQKSASQDTVKCTEHVDDVTVQTADIQQRFKFFETYREPEKQRKKFRITPPREGQVKGSTPEREVYHDPDIVRSEETGEDSVIAKESHTATKMLSKFRQMEENLSKEPTPQGPKPLKRFTPPPEPTREESSSEEGSESEEEDVEQLDQTKVYDEDLIEAQKAARAKQLRAKFEKWEAQEIKKEQNNSSINILEEYGEDQSQIESTKLLRARFESMRESHTEVNKPRAKVNRFVEFSNIMENCEGCKKRVYPLEKISVHGHLYHKSCFKCKECGTILRMDSYTYNQGRLYCTPHFKRLFISKGNYDSAFGLDEPKEKWNSTVA